MIERAMAHGNTARSPSAPDGIRSAFPVNNAGVLMSDRLVGGGVAAVAAILTLVQLLWMFGMFSPADALGGRNGAAYAIALVAWFFFTLGPLVAAAIVLLMTRDESPAHV